MKALWCMCYWSVPYTYSTESMNPQDRRGLAQAIAIHAFYIVASILSVSVSMPVIIHTPWKDSLQGALANTHRVLTIACKPGCLTASHEG